MKNGIHFLSGLPRSGSTLLGALLRQNPKLHAGMSSPVGGIIGRVHSAAGSRSGFGTLLTDTKRRDIFKGIVEAFYKDVSDEKMVVDTNRGWCARLPLINALYPESKIIVCVRDLVWIVDSFERVLRNNALGTSRMFKPQNALTAHARVNALASPNGAVGFAWNATQEAFYGEFSHKLIVVDYEALCREPKRVLGLLYARLGLEPFEHDFDNVTYGEGDAFDADLGVPDLHRVGRKVRFAERATILPPEVFQRFSGRNFWRRPGGNPRGVEVILPSQMTDGPPRFQPPNPGMNQGGRMVPGRLRPPVGR